MVCSRECAQKRNTQYEIPAEWRNGRRWGLKIPCPLGRVGSTPTSAIAENRGQKTEDREKTVIKSAKDFAEDCMYITKDKHERLDNGYDEINAMLYSLMSNWKSLSDF